MYSLFYILFQFSYHLNRLSAMQSYTHALYTSVALVVSFPLVSSSLSPFNSLVLQYKHHKSQSHTYHTNYFYFLYIPFHFISSYPKFFAWFACYLGRPINLVNYWKLSYTIILNSNIYVYYILLFSEKCVVVVVVVGKRVGWKTSIYSHNCLAFLRLFIGG